jgi:flavin-dependent dehydrogenase
VASHSTDVAIVGGGPAGAACAISLRRDFPHLHVALFEATDYSRERPGEILSVAAVKLLGGLGVSDADLRTLGIRSESVASAWGGSQLVENHSLFSTQGSGFHLERNAFDRYLGEVARSLGAHVEFSAQLRSAHRDRGDWSLTLSNNLGVNARFLIDATGRSAMVARSFGARVRMLDRLTAYSCFFDQCSEDDRDTLVESCAMGWWYTASLPHRRRVASLLTDADLGRFNDLHATDAWNKNLEKTQYVAARLAGGYVSYVRVSPACSTLLDRLGGEGWIAVGDAALAFDPLAGQGMTSSIRSGILASYAAHDSLSGGGRAALDRYQAVMRVQFAGLAKTRRFHYEREGRWRTQPFWQRRQTGNEFASMSVTSIANAEG